MNRIKKLICITALMLTASFMVPAVAFASEPLAQSTDEEADAAGAVKVQSISISNNPDTMIVGKKVWLKAHVKPEGLKDKKIIWRSSDIKIATVDKYGKVKAVGSGIVRISASCGGKRTSCRIKVNIKGVITIIDDDGRREFMTKLMPIVRDKNISIATAVVPKWVGSKARFMTWDDIAKCESEGAEVLCHTLKHRDVDPTKAMKTKEIKKEYAKARKILKEHGYDSDVLVYPHETGKLAKAQKAASQVFGCGLMHDEPGINTADENLYCLNRYLIEGPIAERPWETREFVDKVKKEGGWMIWELHCGIDRITDTAVENLRKAVDYAKEQGVEIVTAQEGYERLVNKQK